MRPLKIDEIDVLAQRARTMWAAGKNTYEIAKALGVRESFVVNNDLHRRDLQKTEAV